MPRDMGGIHAGLVREKADRLSSSQRARTVRIQSCNKVVKGQRCEQESAVTVGARNRCLDHLTTAKRRAA